MDFDLKFWWDVCQAIAGFWAIGYVLYTLYKLGIEGDDKNGKKTVLSYMSEDEADKMAEKLSIEASEVFSDVNGSDIICKLPIYLLKRTK